MKVTRLFIVICSLALIVGCSDDPIGTNNTSEATYFDVGSYWVYDVIYYDTNGIVISTVEDSLWIAKVETVSSKMTVTYSTGATYIYDSLGMRNTSTDSYWYFSKPDKGDTCWNRRAIPIKLDNGKNIFGNILRSVIEVNLPTATVAGPFIVDEYITIITDTTDSPSLSQDYEFYDYSIGLIESHQYGSTITTDTYHFKERRVLKRYHIAKQQ